MQNLQNLHTHSTFCDGVDTPEEMVNIAIEKGFDSIGFSGHSYMQYSKNYSMSLENTKEYITDVNRLKMAYKDKIGVFLGLEFDMYSNVDLSDYNYLIGSMHYFKFGDNYIGFDRGAEECESIIKEYFSGDGLKFAKEYYKQFAELPQYGNFDIIGHFDLITKNLEKAELFDCNSKEYFYAALETLECFKGKIPFFEVNTGAIARGYRSTPYPSIPLLKELKKMGFGAVISSDCHNGKFLDCGFEDAREMLKECGFKERYILTENGFKAVNI